MITEAGTFSLPDEEYLADPVEGGSLSRSGARMLLPPSCPAIFHWHQTHPAEHKPDFDFGHAAHKLVLGVGADIEVIDAADWRTKAAREARDEAYMAGRVPLLTEDAQAVQEMAEALRADPLAAALLDRPGQAERALVVKDDRTGVWLRCKLDFLPDATSDGRLIIADYKTSRSADPTDFGRSAHDYGYAMQHAWYCDTARTLGLADDVRLVFIVQRKTAPYLVSVVELDEESVQIGRHLNRQAIDLYAACRETGTWPSHTGGQVITASLPPWVHKQYEEIA